MNNTAKNLIRVVGVVAGLGAAVWALRDKLLPAPEAHTELPPRFRTGTENPNDVNDAGNDDLRKIKGIGPVTAAKLADNNISTFAAIATMTADDLAAVAGTSSATARAWIESASGLG